MRTAQGVSRMPIHFLNGFTCNARVPAAWRTGALCLLIESDDGLVLVDTGLGREDYRRRPAIVRAFRVLTHVPLDPAEAAIEQVSRLGYKPTDVRHIVLTQMHFDHCGGLPDFPDATIHVHRRELEAFLGRPRRWTDIGYERRHVAHGPHFLTYEEAGDSWHGLPAVRLPFTPEMWLVPLAGHTRGHCAVAVATPDGWLMHVGDAAIFGGDRVAPDWFVRLVLGPHGPALRAFRATHHDVRMTTGHMPRSFFAASPPLDHGASR
jgi:glyoxylase-like metal-dependent hydrolase (beta-lactamase superfamily II)